MREVLKTRGEITIIEKDKSKEKNYFFENFSFYLLPELGLLKYAQDQKIQSQFQKFVNLN